MIIRKVLFLFLVFTFTQYAQHKIISIGDLELTSGKYLHDCMIGYRTYGVLNSEKSNAILLPSWFLGTADQLHGFVSEMIDTNKFFVITVDALGNGISCSPSNYNKEYPDISVKDMVHSQYKLANKLGIEKLHAVIGSSMGGIQAFEWAVTYSEKVEVIIPLVGTPKPSTADLLLWGIQKKLIKDFKPANDNDLGKMFFMIFNLVITTPEHINKEFDIKKILEQSEQQGNGFKKENVLKQLDAMINHNIFAGFENNPEAAVKAIKSKMLIIVINQDQVITPAAAKEFAKLLNAEVLELNTSCGHLGTGCETKIIHEKITEYLQ